MTMNLTAIIKKGEKQYVALCPEIDVVSQGYTVEDALKNLREAAELYLEEFDVPEEIKGEEMLVTHLRIKDATDNCQNFPVVGQLQPKAVTPKIASPLGA